MKRITLLSVACISLITCSAVANVTSSSMFFSGIYIGSGTGIGGSFNKTILIHPKNTDNPGHFNNSHIGYALTAHLGYAFASYQYRLIPELFVQYAPQASATIVTGSNIHFNYLSNRFAWGMRIKLARQITHKTILAVLLGMQSSQFCYSIINTSVETMPMSQSYKWQSGWLAGIGTETMFTKHIAVSLNIQYTNYGTIINHESIMIKENPSAIFVLVGINYYFHE